MALLEATVVFVVDFVLAVVDIAVVVVVALLVVTEHNLFSCGQ